MIIRKLENINTFITGQSHLKKDLPCQDRTKYLLKNGTHVLSLSDGAGSKKYSQIGADIVTDAACNYFSINFNKAYSVLNSTSQDEDKINQLKSDFLNYINEQINDYLFQNKSISSNDLLCTLEFVAIHSNKYIAGHCGDGVIGKLIDNKENELLEVLSKPQNGGATNLTYFINENNSINHLRLYSGSMNNVEGFILMSDGPEEVLYNENLGLNENTNIFFNIVKDISATSLEKKQAINKILETKLANISYDDLSINVIIYMELDLESNLKNDQINSFLNEGIYKNQIIIESGYYATINKTKEGIGNLLTGTEAINYLKNLWRTNQ